MKHIRNYENHRTNKTNDLAINEKTLNIDNDIMVVANIRIPRSVVNGYIKKVKDLTGQDLKDTFGESVIAEEIVKYISTAFINVDSIPVNALIGGPDPQAQTQATQDIPQGEAQVQVQEPAAAQAEPQAQVQVQAPVQAPTEDNGFEDIQAQPQAQVQTQVQAQETEEEGDEENNDLPI